MDDITKLESSMSNMERLTQRMVLLFELQLGPQLARINDNVGDAVKPVKHIVDTTKALGRPLEDIANDLKAAGHTLEEAAKDEATQVPVSAKKMELSLSRYVHNFNKMADGAQKLDQASRQAFTTAASLASTLVTSASKLESSSAQAAAASKGMLTTTQWLSKTAGYFSSISRNVSQFGPYVGGLLSAVEIVTDYTMTTRRKLEVQVANVKRRSDIAFAGEVNFKKASQSGLTGTQIEKQALIDELERRRQFAANVKSRDSLLKSELLPSSEREQLRKDKILANIYANEKNSKIEELKTLTYKELEENKNSEKLKALNAATDSLSKELFATKLGAAQRNYEAESSAIAKAQAAQVSLLGKGDDENVFASLIELAKQAQEVAIAKLQEEYDNAIAALERNKPTDIEGNVLEVAVINEQKRLLNQFTKGVESLVTPFSLDPNSWNIPALQRSKIKLTDAAKAKLTTAAANINNGAGSAIAKNQSAITALGQSDSDTRDQATLLARQARDNQAATASTAALAHPGLYYDGTDPLAAVDIKLRKLSQDLAFFEAQRETATGNNVAIVDANITATTLAMEALERTDTVLAKRANRATDLRIEVEKLQRGLLQANAKSEVDGAKRNELLERRKRQLATSGDAPGAGGLISIQMQDEEMERQRKSAKSLVDMLKERYDLAVKGNEGEATILSLKNDLMSAQTAQVKLINDQVLAAAKQNSMLEFQLTGDKSAFSRFGHSKRLGGSPSWANMFSRPADLGSGLGSESARMTSAFNESWRRKYGKLTQEEQEAAKEERKMNNQLERSREAIRNGGGTNKQKALVRMYDEQKAVAEDKMVKLIGVQEAALSALNKMAGIKKP